MFAGGFNIFGEYHQPDTFGGFGDSTANLVLFEQLCLTDRLSAIHGDTDRSQKTVFLWFATFGFFGDNRLSGRKRPPQQPCQDSQRHDGH